MGVLQNYRPRLYYYTVKWLTPHQGRIKYNTNGTSRGNTGDSAYSFYLRNDLGDLICAEAKVISNRTNIVVEIIVILKPLRYCNNNDIMNIEVETNSLSLIKMIRKEWRFHGNM